MPDIRIGTSAFTAEGWVGSFYPEGTQPRDADHSDGVNPQRRKTAPVQPVESVYSLSGLPDSACPSPLSHEEDIAKVQEWLADANVSTTRLYDRRKSKREDSPTYHVKY